MKYFTKLILFLFSVILLTQCQKKEEIQVKNEIGSVTDINQNLIELEKPPTRVVVLYEPLMEAVYMLGVEDKLVGIPSKTYTSRDSYDYFSLLDTRIKEKSLATPGDFESANLESIIGLNADLVLAYDLPDNVVQTLKNAGTQVYIGKSATSDNIKKEITDLGKIFHKEDRSTELLNFVEQEFAQMKENVVGIDTKSAYFSWANGRVFTTTGTTSMMHECLVFAGVENVCKTELDQANINPETLVSWNPDVIYTWNDSPSVFYDHPQLKNVTAIKDRQVYNLMPMFFYNPHTLKSVLTSMMIQQWAYSIYSEEEIKQKSRIYLIELYGEEKGKALNEALNPTTI